MIDGRKFLNLSFLGFCILALFLFACLYPFKSEQVRSFSGNSSKAKQQSSKHLTARKDFFVEYRLDRERLRSQQSEFLEDIIRDPAVDSVTRKEVNDRLLKLNTTAEQELNIENMIKAKGYEDAIAIVHDGCVDIIIKAGSLLGEDVATIGSIAVKNTGINLEHIVIMNKSS